MFVQITRPTLVGSRCHAAGDVIEVDSALGARLINWGAAVKAGDQVPAASSEVTSTADPDEKPKRTRRGK